MVLMILAGPVLIGMPNTSSFGIHVEVGVHGVARLLEDKQSRGGGMIVSPVLLALELISLLF